MYCNLLFSGVRLNPVSASPCRNEGKCNVDINKPLCDCKPGAGYVGDTCEESVCKSDTCHNGGSCTATSNNHPMCTLVF